MKYEMVKKSKAFIKLNIGDHLADTRHLTATEHGAYFLMLMHYYNTKKPLPDDDTQLQRISGLKGKVWKEKKPILAQFFKIENGVWRQEKADRELGILNN